MKIFENLYSPEKKTDSNNMKRKKGKKNVTNLIK